MLSRGGYQARNPVNLSTILGSKWTAHERTFGWRHFRVLNKKKEGGKTVFVEVPAPASPRRLSRSLALPGSPTARRAQRPLLTPRPDPRLRLKPVVGEQMQATCDPDVRFWVNSQNLKERDRWSCGWVRRHLGKSFPLPQQKDPRVGCSAGLVGEVGS